MKRISLFLLLGLLAACSSAPKPELTLPQLYDDAYEKFADEDYRTAAEKFAEVERNFPADAWAADALVMSAYSSYMDGDFAGALLTTERFMRFHPGHKDVAYVLYLRGMCFYRQVSDARRDPEMAGYALNSFQLLTQRFPKSEYAENAQNKITILKNYIAGKIMYSARRDMFAQNWASAITQLQTIVADMQETVMTEEALFRLTECYNAIGVPAQAAGYGDMLRKNFPNGEWVRKLK